MAVVCLHIWINLLHYEDDQQDDYEDTKLFYYWFRTVL